MPRQLDTKSKLSAVFFTRKELADFLGVSYDWIRRHEPELPHFRVGNTRIFPKAPFEQMAQGKYDLSQLTSAWRMHIKSLYNQLFAKESTTI